MKTSRPICAFVSVVLLLSFGARNECFAQESTLHSARSAVNDVLLATCSPDGEFFVSVNARGRIIYGRTSDGATLRSFYQCHPKAIVFSRDGRLFACVGESNGSPARIKVWDVDDGKLLCRMQTEGGSNPILSFSPDGRVLASTTGGSSIDFWQIPQGTLLSRVKTSDRILRLTFSGGGSDIVATSTDGRFLRVSVP